MALDEKLFAELRKRGAGDDLAAQTAGSALGPWRLANSPALSIALSNAYFELAWDSKVNRETDCLTRRTAGCGPACPVVWEGRSREASPYPHHYLFPSQVRAACEHPTVTALHRAESSAHPL